MVGKQTAQDIKEIIIKENQELVRINEEQTQKILELETRLEEFTFSLPDHSQQIDDIENSIAQMYQNVNDKIDDKIEESLENNTKKNNPFLPLLISGSGILGILIALGLNLDFQFGASKISYNGEGVTGGLVSIVIAATGGGVVSTSFKPLKELLAKVQQ